MLNKTNTIIISMVKNSKGGKNSKRIARKHVVDITQRTVRYVKEYGEMYGVVSKHFGGQCEVVTSDGVSRLCIVRGKFKGRQRRDNNITLGTWVMVGIRDWEVRGDGKTKCDLLYVYSDLDKDDVRQNSDVNLKELDKINTDINGVVVDNDVVFKEDTGENYLIDQPELENSDQEDISFKDNSATTDDVNEEKNKPDNSTVCKNKYEFDIDEI